MEDADQLSFDAFAALVQQHEPNKSYSREELHQRFAKMDRDASGSISMHEYLLGVLREKLRLAAARAIEVFKDWDDDGSGSISKSEFRRALATLGLHARAKEADAAFDGFDVDKSGVSWPCFEPAVA